MKLFAKEKDIALKIVNSIMVIVLVFAIIIMLGTGIKLVNKEKIMTYEEYAKEVCTLDKLEYECTDEVCKKELDKEREKTCSKYYLEDKASKKRINSSAVNNFLISLSTTVVVFLFLHIINKKYN